MNNFVSCSGDWYFIEPSRASNKTLIFPVAIWQKDDKDNIVGLIGPMGTDRQTIVDGL